MLQVEHLELQSGTNYAGPNDVSSSRETLSVHVRAAALSISTYCALTVIVWAALFPIASYALACTL